MNYDPMREALLSVREHKRAAVRIYEAAIACAPRDDMVREWQANLACAHRHERALARTAHQAGIAPEIEAPDAAVIQEIAAKQITTMHALLEAGDFIGAELLACDSVLRIETDCYDACQRLSGLLTGLAGDEARVLRSAVAALEEKEDPRSRPRQGRFRLFWRKSREGSNRQPENAG